MTEPARATFGVVEKDGLFHVAIIGPDGKDVLSFGLGREATIELARDLLSAAMPEAHEARIHLR